MSLKSPELTKSRITKIFQETEQLSIILSLTGKFSVKFKAIIFNTSAVFSSGFLRVCHFINNELMVQRHRKQEAIRQKRHAWSFTYLTAFTGLQTNKTNKTPRGAKIFTKNSSPPAAPPASPALGKLPSTE